MCQGAAPRGARFQAAERKQQQQRSAAEQTCSPVPPPPLDPHSSSGDREAVNPLAPQAVERAHVFAVYDSIATHWHHTRGLRKVHWPVVKSFLEARRRGSLVADVGCGDGKYFGLNKNIVTIGKEPRCLLLLLLLLSRTNS